MFKSLNKGVSTPIAIGIILAITILVAGVLCWYYTGPGRGFKSSEIEFSERAKIGLQEIIEIYEDSLAPHLIWAMCGSIGTMDEKIGRCMTIKDKWLSEREDCLMLITPLTVEVCDSIDDSTGARNTPKSDCYLSVAEERLEVSICDRISDDLDTRIDCYRELATVKQDTEICQRISRNYFNNWCSENPTKKMCLYDFRSYEEYNSYNDDNNWCIGVATSNILRCDMIEDISKKYDCYIELAEYKDDLSICDKTEGGYRQRCYSNIAVLRGDIFLCNKLGENYKDLCYKKIAIEKSDTSLCELMKYDAAECYTVIGIRDGDISLCDKMEGSMWSFEKLQCYILAIQKRAEDLSKHLNEKDISFYNEYCNEHFTERLPVDFEGEEDINVCHKFRKEIEKMGYDSSGIDECYVEVAVTKGNVLICDEFVESDYNKFGCYERIAKKKQDPSLCDRIGIEGDYWLFSSSCYKDLAVILEDEFLCEKIKRPESVIIKNDCFKELARIKNNPSICERIVDKPPGIKTIETIRQNCHEQFSRNGE